jgi:hypothetical protein
MRTTNCTSPLRSKASASLSLSGLIAAAESIGMLDIVVKAQNTLAGNDSERESSKQL